MVDARPQRTFPVVPRWLRVGLSSVAISCLFAATEVRSDTPKTAVLPSWEAFPFSQIYKGSTNLTKYSVRVSYMMKVSPDGVRRVGVSYLANGNRVGETVSASGVVDDVFASPLSNPATFVMFSSSADETVTVSAVVVVQRNTTTYGAEQVEGYLRDANALGHELKDKCAKGGVLLALFANLLFEEFDRVVFRSPAYMPTDRASVTQGGKVVSSLEWRGDGFVYPRGLAQEGASVVLPGNPQLVTVEYPDPEKFSCSFQTAAAVTTECKLPFVPYFGPISIGKDRAEHILKSGCSDPR